MSGLMRPYPMALTEQDAMFDVARAAREFSTAEPLILYGETAAVLEERYNQLKRGYITQFLKVNDVGMRMAMEFQPLRDEYPVGKSRPIDHAGFTRDEMRALIRLMARVQVKEELGGAHDGE
jgi:hypothetical protein